MKHMIIRGNVQGGHTIKDLGLTLQYGQEAPVPLQRAGYSRDLSYAIQSKCVIKVGEKVLGGVPLPPSARIKPVVVPTKPPRRSTPPPPPTKGEQELDELREMNRKLMETLATLTDSQDKLLNKLSEVVESGGAVTTQTVIVREEVSSNKKAPSRVVEEEDAWEDEEDEPVIFIPSKIRSDKTVVSDNNSVEEETKEASDKMDQASQALAAMKKGRKTRRSKNEK